MKLMLMLSVLALMTGCVGSANTVAQTEPILIRDVTGVSRSQAITVTVDSGAANGFQTEHINRDTGRIELAHYDYPYGMKVVARRVIAQVDEISSGVRLTLWCREDTLGRSPEQYVDAIWSEISRRLVDLGGSVGGEIRTLETRVSPCDDATMDLSTFPCAR